MKDTNSGAILPVEPQEAAWNLEVRESCSIIITSALSGTRPVATR